ncbi:MAG: transposase [Candidatus Accumulibacter regalis]
MRKIVDVLRLSHESGLSHREIARVVKISPTTVGEILRRAKLSEVAWPLPAGMSEQWLEAQLYPPAAPSSLSRPEPDWPVVHRELRRKGVTLDLLWQEYKANHPEGYHYSGFCAHYRQWVVRLSVSLRQTHTPGEKLFIDYAGPTVPITDPMTGEVRQAAIFIAVLGASNYTYCEATWSQSLPDWIGSHVRTFEHLNGCTALLVADNLKSGVTTPCFYEPELNPTYRDLATHYGTAVLPARPHRPKDKESASYCTLCGSWKSHKTGRCRTVAPALTFDEGDISYRFKEATLLVAIAMLAQKAITSPLINRRWADPQLCSQLARRKHSALPETLETTLEVIGIANDDDFLGGEGFSSPVLESLRIELLGDLLVSTG